jgi:hypothetical protein
MTKFKHTKRLLFAGGALTLLCAWLAFLVSVRYPVLGWLRGEPFFDGMPASYYARTLVVPGGEPPPDFLSFALARVNDRAAQCYAERCKAQSAHVWQALRQPEAVEVLRTLARDYDGDVRFAALSHLISLGPKATAATDVLLRLLECPGHYRVLAAYALVRVAPSRERDAVASILKILKHHEALEKSGSIDPLDWKNALYFLGEWRGRPAVREALPQLVAMCRDHRLGDGTFALSQLVSDIDRRVALQAGLPYCSESYRWDVHRPWLGLVVQPESWPRLTLALAAGSDLPTDR